MKTKNIFILGPPASGKTTFVSFLSKSASRANKSLLFVNDGEIYRLICPKKSDHKKNYYYQGDKLIFLPQARDGILRDGLKKMAQLGLEAQGNYRYCLLEFTYPDWAEAIKNYFQKLLSLDTVLVFFDYDEKLAFLRNRKRKASLQIPKSYLLMFRDDKTTKLFSLFKKVIRINNQGSLSELEKKAREFFSC